jgi:Domain of unknown function (DUF5134)
VAGPAWLAGPLAVVMIGTAAYCVSRLAAAWRWRRPAEYDVDAAHALMGVAMAGMLVPRLNPFGTGGWEVIFGLAAAWFGGRAARQYLARHRAGDQAQRLHHLHHLLASGAMLYMLACAARVAGVAGRAAGAAMADPAMAGMPGSPGTAAGPPSLTLGLALALFAGVIWAVDQLFTRPAPAAVAAAGHPAAVAGASPAPVPAAPAGGSPVARARPPMSPRLAACCEIAMGVTMSYMLITML